MLLEDIAVDDTVLISGTIKDIKIGTHFDSVSVLLDNAYGPPKTIEIEPENIGTDSADLVDTLADLAAKNTLLARYVAIAVACGMTITELEAATIVEDGVTHVVTITPAT